MRFFGEAIEFYTLQHEAQRSEALDAELRADVARVLKLADQRHGAAELLHYSGAREEGLRLAAEAFELLRSAAAKLPDVTTEDLDPKVPEDLPDPRTDEHNDLFERIVEARKSLRARVLPYALDDRGRRRRQWQRLGWTVVALFAVSLAVRAYVRRPRVYATASASYNSRYLPTNVLDGNDYTHWLLPDRTTGWLELKLVPPREVETISILNGFDPPLYGLGGFRIDAFRNGSLVKSTDASFSGQAARPKPPFSHIAFATGEAVDTIRISVQSTRALGGGIAEVRIR